MTYAPTRPIMTAAELREHHVIDYGRNYAESQDGWEDMEVERKRGWHELASWGRDGWNLGTWPYVILYTCEKDGRWELMSVCEGDRSVYWFDSLADREAALDYLFLWYSADARWSPITWQQREALDAGEITVEDKWRGPYRDEGVIDR